VCGRVGVKHRKTVRSGKPVVEEEETTKVRNEINRLCAADSSDINSHFKQQFVGPQGTQERWSRQETSTTQWQVEAHQLHTRYDPARLLEAHSHSHFADLAPEKHRSHRPSVRVPSALL